MATNHRQEELRALMKEARQKSKKPTNSSVKKIDQTTTSVAAAGASTSQKTAPLDVNKSTSTTPAVPAGFFDDAVADAKARNVDLKQLAEKQLENDWVAFQDFVAEVEKQDAKEAEEEQEEAKERAAVEQLDNMQYMDRYRVVLERVVKRQAGADGSATDKRIERTTEDEHVNDVAEETNVNPVDDVVAAMKKRRKKRKVESEEKDDEFDPCNWRSRGI